MSSPVVLITGALLGIGRAKPGAFVGKGGCFVASGRREQDRQRARLRL